MKAFSRRNLGGIRKLLAEEKKRLFQARAPFLGEGWGFTRRITSLVAIRKIQTGLSHSWEELKLQVNFGLLSWAQATPPGASFF